MCAPGSMAKAGVCRTDVPRVRGLRSGGCLPTRRRKARSATASGQASCLPMSHDPPQQHSYVSTADPFAMRD